MVRAGGDLNLIQDKSPSISGGNAMNKLGDGVWITYDMPVWMILLIAADCVIVAGLAVWGFFTIRKKLKNPK